MNFSCVLCALSIICCLHASEDLSSLTPSQLDSAVTSSIKYSDTSIKDEASDTSSRTLTQSFGSPVTESNPSDKKGVSGSSKKQNDLSASNKLSTTTNDLAYFKTIDDNIDPDPSGDPEEDNSKSVLGSYPTPEDRDIILDSELADLSIQERGTVKIEPVEGKMFVIKSTGDGVEIIPVRAACSGCNGPRMYKEIIKEHKCCKDAKCFWGCLTTFLDVGAGIFNFVRGVAPIVLVVVWLWQNGKIDEIGGWIEALQDGNITIT